MAFHGADTDQLRDFAEAVSRGRSTVQEREDTLSSAIARLDMIWQGADAEAFRSHWQSAVRPKFDEVAGLLEQARTRAAEQAQEQDRTSDAGGSSSHGWSGVLGPVGMGVTIAGAGASAAFAWNNRIQHGAFRPRDANGRFTSPRGMGWWETANAATDDTNWSAKPGQAGRYAGFARLGRAAGPVGTLLGGGLAGFDQYLSDSADPSVSEGEALRNGAIAGGSNMAGGVAGAIGGAKVGAMVGALGGPVGAAVGGVVGGVIGGIAGSSLGDAIGDGLIGLFG